MNRCIRRNREKTAGRCRGAEVLELALLLPLLLGLAFGAAAWGFFFFVQHNVQGAAREGARAGIPFSATQAQADAKISNYLTNAGLTPADFSISFSHNVETASAGTDITVTVEGTWSTVGVTLLPPPFSPAPSKIVRGRAVMRKEG